MNTIPGIWFPGIYEAAKDQPYLTEIATPPALSVEAFRERFASRSIPFLIRQAFPVLIPQEAIHQLTQQLGHYPLSVRFGDMSNPDTYLNRRTAEMPLADFIEGHFLSPVGDEIAYAGSSVINDDFLNLLGINYPSFYPTAFFNKPRLWMGRAGTVTPLHKDIPDNFSYAYFGRKRWLIYPPRDYPYLYMVNPHEEEVPDFGASQVNLNAPDYDQFPEFAKAHAIEFIQEAGDMLYLPAGWSHYVQNLEDTLMINFWLLREKSPAILGNDR